MRFRSAAAGIVVVCALTGCSSPDAPTGTASSASDVAPAPASRSGSGFEAAMRHLEQRYGARLGVTALDTGTGAVLAHRAHERFAFASTGKVAIAAATLRDASDADLDAVVHYSAEDLLEYAPVTSRHVGTGMSVRALLDAAVRFSDNTAANLLVDRLGGPAAVERYLRSIGDTTTEVDRLEPQLNTAVPGDRRDTTTPAASAADLRAVLLGEVLPTDRRSGLERLMRASTTGGPYIRAGVPEGWIVADKTGSGAYGVRNDVAVLRAPQRAPIVLVLLSDRGRQDADSQDGLLADATRAVVEALGEAD